MLRITINGETHSFAVGTTVGQMLEALELPREGVAVEVNRGIVPKRTHQEAVSYTHLTLPPICSV